MKRTAAFSALLLALLLAWTLAPAEGADFAALSGEWYTDEISMTLTEDGRFTLGWNDGDWTGTLAPEAWTDEEGEELTAYRLKLEEPKETMWDELMLVPDFYHAGKLTLYRDGTPGDVFWNVPVCVVEIDAEELEYEEPVARIDTTGGEELPTALVVTFLRPVRDAAIMKMYDQEINEEGVLCYNGTTLEWWEFLDSRSSVAITHIFEGDMPELSVSFIGAEDEISYHFAIQLSGADGQPELIPLPASEG